MPQVFKPTVRTPERSLANEDQVKLLEQRKLAMAAFGMHEVALTENQIRSIRAALGYYDKSVGVCTKAIQNQLGLAIGEPAIPKRDFQIELFNSAGQCVLDIAKFSAYSEEDIEANELDAIIAEHGFEGEVEYAITALKSAESEKRMGQDPALQEDSSCPF